MLESAIDGKIHVSEWYKTHASCILKHPVLGCLIVQTLWSAKTLQLSSRKADLFFTQWKGGCAIWQSK